MPALTPPTRPFPTRLPRVPHLLVQLREEQLAHAPSVLRDPGPAMLKSEDTITH